MTKPKDPMNSLLHDVRSAWSADVTECDAVALFLHGYGSNERDLAGLADALELAVPWASLRAPREMGNGGNAWFEIVTPGDPDPEPVATATQSIWAWVDAHVDPKTRIIPIGFSQGGLMASQLLRTRPDRVLAPVILGGFVAGAAQAGDDLIAQSRPPVFWGRGAEDRVIGVAAISRTSGFLPSHSSLRERVYAGLGHGINAVEILDVRTFLIENVGANVINAR
jgi:phospholipase/carboxylesterase